MLKLILEKGKMRLNTNKNKRINLFQARVPFVYPLKMFPGVIEMEHWHEIGLNKLNI